VQGCPQCAGALSLVTSAARRTPRCCASLHLEQRGSRAGAERFCPRGLFVRAAHAVRPARQTCRFATGIDTGCVLGDCLTAVVLPSVAGLAARGFRPAAVLAAGAEGVTLAALGAELVSVPAARNYAGSDKD